MQLNDLLSCPSFNSFLIKMLTFYHVEQYRFNQFHPHSVQRLKWKIGTERVRLAQIEYMKLLLIVHSAQTRHDYGDGSPPILSKNVFYDCTLSIAAAV